MTDGGSSLSDVTRGQILSLMTSNSRLWLAKIFPVSICDSNASAVVLGGNAGLFLLRYTQEINWITEHNAFVSVSGSKKNHRTGHLGCQEC